MSDETGDVAARGDRDRLLTLITADLRALDPPDDDGYALLQVYIKDCDVDDFTSCLPDCVGLVGYGEAFMGCRGLVRRQHLHQTRRIPPHPLHPVRR